MENTDDKDKLGNPNDTDIEEIVNEGDEQIGKLGEGFAASGIQLHLVALFGGDATIAVELRFILPI